MFSLTPQPLSAQVKQALFESLIHLPFGYGSERWAIDCFFIITTCDVGAGAGRLEVWPNRIKRRKCVDETLDSRPAKSPRHAMMASVMSARRGAGKPWPLLPDFRT